MELTLLSPGSVIPDNSTFNNGDNTANGGRPYINGNREQSNNFILDGMDNNQTSDNLLAFTPSPDAIQEFNLITANAPAEFGNFQGGIVNASIKSGHQPLPRRCLGILPQRCAECQSVGKQVSGRKQ